MMTAKVWIRGHQSALADVTIIVNIIVTIVIIAIIATIAINAVVMVVMFIIVIIVVMTNLVCNNDMGLSINIMQSL